MDIFIHKSELLKIKEFVSQYPDLETGGDFFGLWKQDGTAIIQFIIGPGDKTKRSSTSFYQDIDYLRKCRKLLNEKYGIEHIGNWHSHHKLSLEEPSGGDINTMRNIFVDNKSIDKFLLSISNIKKNDEVSTKVFFFSKDEKKHIECNLKVLDTPAPFNLDGLENILLENDSAIYVEKPSLATNSYWKTDDGKQYLKECVKELEDYENVKDVEIIQLEDKRIAISFVLDENEMEIRFPNDFPTTKYEVVSKRMPVEIEPTTFVIITPSYSGLFEKFWNIHKRFSDIIKLK